jgi:hypothetical protein
MPRGRAGTGRHRLKRPARLGAGSVLDPGQRQGQGDDLGACRGRSRDQVDDRSAIVVGAGNGAGDSTVTRTPASNRAVKQIEQCWRTSPSSMAITCEWPLGRDLDDARAMASLAAEQGVRTAVGLQARQAPAIEFVQELLSDGYVGEVLSTTMVGISVPGDVVGQPNAYMLEKTNGANVLTIAVGHSLDTLNYVLGEFAELSAISDLRRLMITIEETGKQIVKTAADQIAVIGAIRYPLAPNALLDSIEPNASERPK